MVARTRQALTAFLGAKGSPDRLVFTQNASDSLNIAIQGTLKAGDHVIATCLDHNSVLRPVYHLSHYAGIEATYVSFNAQGFVDPDDVARAMRSNTRLVVMTHASNVLGTVQPVAAVGAICRRLVGASSGLTAPSTFSIRSAPSSEPRYGSRLESDWAS